MNFLISDVTEIDASDSRTVLATDTLKALNAKSTPQGLIRLVTHLLILGVSGWVWGTTWGQNWFAFPALIIYGFGLAAMFAPLHECVHRTAFANNALNDAVGWLAGLCSFYNSAFFRRYHTWHHRYTQDLEKDPERSDPSPQTWGEYLWTLSGLPWWWGKLKTHTRVALGQLDSYPFISENARSEVIRSTRVQLAIYAIAILISVVAQQPWFLMYWLFPLAVGQPILRFILLAEHTGCSEDRNPLTNTRTTLTLWPLRLLMWNMPFHAEHHLYPSMPFHQLPAAHQQLKSHLTHVASGYLQVNRNIVAAFKPQV